MSAHIHASGSGLYGDRLHQADTSKAMVVAEGAFISPPLMVGDSKAMRRLRQQIAQLSSATCNVLIQGESGVGKELVARHLHAGGKLTRRPFIPVDCSALCESLFESQLFGHTKGAFTGADRGTLGFFRAADGGTLFLDEIGELSLPMQVKLLRCIQEKAVIPVGAERAVPVNVRLIAATNRDLRQMVKEGAFREDLFYRLHVVCLTVPPLRQRREDIAALIEQLIADMAALYNEAPKVLSAEARQVLHRYDWPGNVRELANAIEYLFAMHVNKFVEPDDLPAHLLGEPDDPHASDDRVLPLHVVERQAVQQALRHAHGNQAQAARLLEIDARKLYRMVRRYQLQELTRTGRD